MKKRRRANPNLEARWAAVESMHQPFMDLPNRIKAASTIMAVMINGAAAANEAGDYISQEQMVQTAMETLSALGVTDEELRESVAFLERTVNRVEGAG